MSGIGAGGLISVFQSQLNGAADGTGIVVLLDKAHALLGNDIPSFLIDYVQGQQLGLFGSYPDHKDIAPSAVFVAVFAILALAHLFIFSVNYSRGHKFWLSLGFCFYCLDRVIGFAMRISWAKNITKVKVGIASEVFLIIGTIYLASMNLVLAQRLFTWRHPFLGSRKYFWAFMLTVYTIVIAVIVMTIVAAVVPYLYLLSQHHYNMCIKVVEASSILVCLYSVLAIGLVSLAFLIPTTKKDRETYTYQPWWIKSFGPTYYVEENACQNAEESFMKRNHDHRHAVRTIASTHAENYFQVEGLTDGANSLKHNHSIFIVALTSVIVLIGAIMRCITVFEKKTYATETNVFKPVVMYIVWGLLETIVNLIYLIGRADLRFYRPDRLPKRVRNIVTADQSSIESSAGEKDLADFNSANENPHIIENNNNTIMERVTPSHNEGIALPEEVPAPTQDEIPNPQVNV